MRRRGASGLNCLLAVDKPLGMTSHDVVSRTRRALGESRVGHAGTLDPDASGVLVLGIGQGTRLMGHLTSESKSYETLIRFGSETDTDDADGTVLRTAPVGPRLFSPDYAETCVSGMCCAYAQVPPAFSAISVGGVRAYARARAGEHIELKPRPVRIISATLLAVDTMGEAPAWRLALTVSKGCYIRAIARDLGRGLGTFAHVEELRRTSSGSISLDDCVTLEQLAEGGVELARERCLDPVKALGLPVRRLEEETDVISVRCGRQIPQGAIVAVAESVPGPEHLRRGGVDGAPELVSLVWGDRLLGLWERRGRRLACSVNFPDGIEGACRDL